MSRGHAVAASKLGIEVVEVDMLADGGPQVLTNSAVCDDPAAEARRLRASLVFTLSAQVAVCLAGYKFDAYDEIDGRHENEADAEHVHACAALIARLEAGLPTMPSPGEKFIDGPLSAAMRGIVERAWAEAVAFMWDNWSAVARVAAVLAVTHDRLSQDELDQIIAKAASAPEARAPTRLGEFAMQQMIELSGI